MRGGSQPTVHRAAFERRRTRVVRRVEVQRDEGPWRR
jgi:hypothetical protein